jgi:hypothetical protein
MFIIFLQNIFLIWKIFFFFENFNISENNIISVELAKVLRYLYTLLCKSHAAGLLHYNKVLVLVLSYRFSSQIIIHHQLCKILTPSGLTHYKGWGKGEPAPTRAPWRMNDKWSGSSFLFGSSSLVNHGGYLSWFFLTTNFITNSQAGY